jgi:RNA polymerase sigma factor (sigma-70 family)
MLDQQRVVKRVESREQLFTLRYQQLLVWALRLTHQQRESAEDLVQDAFIQFTRSQTSLDTIENLDGYLRRMLRYMHLSRLSRNSKQGHDLPLSMVDYDSLHLGWQSLEVQRRLQAHEELAQICQYACIRKETSRAGGVLILRFFHDYFPNEIAKVICSSRHCVDEWQRLARREVKLYLENPGRLKFVTTNRSATTPKTSLSEAGDDLIGALRRMIFTARQGECVPKKQLQEVYRFAKHDMLTTARLGHIVSCRSCLDEVNRLLGLPLLAERYHDEEQHPPEEPPDKNGSGTSGEGAADLRIKYARRLREVVEHLPKELHISVNGVQVGSLKVNSSLSELNLNLGLQIEIDCVEICSEQGVQLLFFSVDETVGTESEQWARIELNNGRTVEASLCVRGEPSLQVTYSEPAFGDVTTPTRFVTKEGDPYPRLSVVKAHGRSSLPNISATEFEGSGAGFRSTLQQMRRALKRTLTGITRQLALVARDSYPGHSIGERYPSSSSEANDLFAWFTQINRKPLWARLEFQGLVLSVIVIAVLLLFRMSIAPPISAIRLLEQASLREEIKAQIPHQVTHRIVNLEERHLGSGEVVKRRKIENWQSTLEGAKRLYDENNNLIAGTWLRADGTRTVFHHGSSAQPQTAPKNDEDLLMSPEDIWQLELSTRDFTSLIGSTDDTNVAENAATYIVNYDSERMIGTSRLLKATIILQRADLHATEQTLLVKRGDEIYEFRFVEASFESLPDSHVAPTVFAPEPSLIGTAGPADGNVTEAKPSMTSDRSFPSLLRSSPPQASTELEIDIAYLLDEVKGDRNEQIGITRTKKGMLRVEGVVESQRRKNELVSSLAQVSNNPAVTIEIIPIEESGRRQKPDPSETVLASEGENRVDTVAVGPELRRYLSECRSGLRSIEATTFRGPGGVSIDEEVRRFSSRTVNRAYRTLFQAIELKKITSQFADVDMRMISPFARAKWLMMVHDHATAFERESEDLRNDIQPIFFARTAPSDIGEMKQIITDADLGRAIERLYRLALGNTEALRAAFTISSRSSDEAFQSIEFWRSLIISERLAAQITQYER